MTLNPHVNYPSTRTYVLKLHRDATPADGQIFGRLESLSSGQHFDFGTGEELLAHLAQDVAPMEAEGADPCRPAGADGDAIRWP